jgi:hypothetical protein
MGTNFYEAVETEGEVSEGRHIGKMNAAGRFCWDCGVTLNRGGVTTIHESSGDWMDKCPRCKKPWEQESLEDSAAGRMLGFCKKPYGRKTGVSTCCSFSWAIVPEDLREVQKIVNEYGRTFTPDEFAKVLEECPIKYLHFIGKEFC